MRAGMLDRRITLQKQDRAQDEYGSPANTWTDVATVWAQKIQRSALEVREAQQEGAVIVEQWCIRYRRDLDEAMRIEYEERGKPLYYYITGITEMKRKAGLILTTEFRESKP